MEAKTQRENHFRTNRKEEKKYTSHSWENIWHVIENQYYKSRKI